MSEPSSPGAGTLKDGVHFLPVRVYWEDTDAGGIVYHANYLKYMERGRSDMLRLLGVDQMVMMEGENRLTFAVRSAHIDYLRSARLDDALVVKTTPTKLGGASIQVVQEVLRDGDCLVRGELKIAIVNEQGRAVRLPRPLHATLSSLNQAPD
ncbi:MAG: tol-pal system-associated acyl-CoA thioesterase [Sphingomonadales bacterium]|nr:tol-pal system-associated acyl-CoA thioesterase [Sphingomonadales bacterium]